MMINSDERNDKRKWERENETKAHKGKGKGKRISI